MREIVIPRKILDEALRAHESGFALSYPVHVNWPELQLTDNQVISNAAATAAGLVAPYDDNSVFTIRLLGRD